MNWLNGKKTYFAAIGMFGLALHQALVEGNYQLALQSFFAGLGFLGLRHAVDKV